MACVNESGRTIIERSIRLDAGGNPAQRLLASLAAAGELKVEQQDKAARVVHKDLEMVPEIRTSGQVRLFRFCWACENSRTMSKHKRKRYTGAFKAKVGLEALMGVKTVGQIAREYQVHPVQVTQWKGVIRDRLPELFELGRPEETADPELVRQLHEKIGQLAVEVDWLKKKCKQLGL